MTDERRRELWQKKLDAMPDDMIVSEYHRRLANRRWAKLNEMAEKAPSTATIRMAVRHDAASEDRGVFTICDDPAAAEQTTDADIRAQLDAILGVNR